MNTIEIDGTMKTCTVCNGTVAKELLLQHIAEHYFLGGLL